MPQFLSAALAQSYASASTDEDILITIELNHASFADGPERFVTGQQTPLVARLEPGAPFNPGETVTFKAMAFDFLPPGHNENGPTPARVKMDNVSGEIARIMRQTISGNDKVEIIYREYAGSDLSQPGQVYYGLMLKKVPVTALSAVGEIGWLEVQEQAFPRQVYDKLRYPAPFVQ